MHRSRLLVPGLEREEPLGLPSQSVAMACVAACSAAVPLALLQPLLQPARSLIARKLAVGM